MNCSACGTPLPAGAAHCPQCGAATPYYYSPSGTTSDSLTVVSSPYTAPQVPPTVYAAPFPGTTAPQSSYNTPTYGTTLPPTYVYDPYNTPPPPSHQRRGNLIVAIAGVILLVVILAGGIFAFVLRPGVRQAKTPAATPITTAALPTGNTGNPYTHTGKLVFSDPLSDNSGGYKWDENATNCAFSGGTYHVKAPDTRYSDYCIAQNTDFSNFVFEVQMQVIKGDAGGMVFRVTSTYPTNKYYQWDFDKVGSYSLDVIDGDNDTTLAGGPISNMNPGLNTTIVLAVVAQGNTITLYADHQQIAHVTDSTYSRGQIGLFASPTENNPTEVVYNDARLWTL